MRLRCSTSVGLHRFKNKTLSLKPVVEGNLSRSACQQDEHEGQPLNVVGPCHRVDEYLDDAEHAEQRQHADSCQQSQQNEAGATQFQAGGQVGGVAPVRQRRRYSRVRVELPSALCGRRRRPRPIRRGQRRRNHSILLGSLIAAKSGTLFALPRTCCIRTTHLAAVATPRLDATSTGETASSGGFVCALYLALQQ